MAALRTMPLGKTERSAPARRPASRLAHVETIRGLACLLLVAFHVVGDNPSHGLHVEPDSAWALVMALFDNVRMPLFSFISGYVLTADPRDGASLAKALTSKARRLLLPLATVSTVYWAVKGWVAHEPVPPLASIYVLPFDHFWFLQATAVNMALLLSLGVLAGGGTRAAALLWPAGVLAFLAAPDLPLDLFSIDEAIGLVPYFLAGYLLRSTGLDRRALAEDAAARLPIAAAAGIALGLLLAVHAVALASGPALDFDKRSLAGLATGLCVCVFLMAARPVSRPLAWIGGHSYAIYLFHVFFTAGARKAALAVNPDVPLGVIFVLALAAGLLLPVAAERIVLVYRPAALLLLGIDRRKGTAPAPAAAPA
jgi:peptidoglycan/LPS O-acetylase OafA/YrhL